MTTTSTMGRVLLLSSDDEPLAAIEDQLALAGYDIHHCHAPGTAAFPCAGLAAGGVCPLERAGGVDVAIDVRQHPWPTPTTREVGVTCALRAGVPVVVVTPHGHPFEDVATATTDGAGDLAKVVEEAIVAALEPARAAASDAVAAVLATHDLGDTPFSVDVERRHGRLRLTINADVATSVAAVAATRAAVAVRRFDRASSALEIEHVVPTAQR